MDNAAIARVLAEIGDLLELKGENPFRVRAYRNAVATIADLPDPVATLAPVDLLALPGIGKDLAARIRELVDTGRLTFHEQLLQEFPPSLLDLLRLQGVGPKTAAELHRTLGVTSLDDLEEAAKAGRVRALKGFGARREQLLLKALEERKRFAGRHLLADAHGVASSLVAFLDVEVPGSQIDAVGSLRRGAETCGDIDILATGDQEALLGTFARYPRAERVLASGGTKASLLARDGYQLDLRVVPSESRGAALQYFTGSKSHNIALRDRALSAGLRLNEYGVFRVDDGTKLAGDTEEGVYAALGLPWIPPELREGRGEIEAALAGRLPSLITQADLRGDLHCHTTATDGKDDVRTMLGAAKANGLAYLAITDHSRALAMANGLDEDRALAHAAAVREAASEIGIGVLAGIECDILPDGSLDLADECLAQLDLVIASVHSAFQQDEATMTARLLKALENPWVDVLGHPTGRLLLRRPPLRMQFDSVLDACATHGVALEINCQVDRLDLNDIHARHAAERGVRLTISTDAHSVAALGLTRWGVAVARRAWLTPEHVLNTRPLEGLRATLRRRRSEASQ